MIDSNIWGEQDKKVKDFEDNLIIPNEKLENVENIKLNSEEIFNKIPREGGCYWITTTEPIKHSFHKRDLPKKIGNFEIIYNGISKDNIQGRVKQHLLIDKDDPGWSGIRIDLLLIAHEAHHRQKALSLGKRARVPYINQEPINNIDKLFLLNLSEKEISYIQNNRDREVFHFKNGINIFHSKHKKYIYKIYYISGLESLTYLDYLEKKWRISYGLPRLCTYISGR